MAQEPRKALDYARGGKLPPPADAVHPPVAPTGVLNSAAISAAWLTVLQISVVLPLSGLSLTYPRLETLLTMSALAALNSAALFFYCTASLVKIGFALRRARVVALAVMGYVASLFGMGFALAQLVGWIACCK